MKTLKLLSDRFKRFSMEYIQKFSRINHTSKLHVLSLLSLALDARRLDRLARQRRADVSLLASPRTHSGATVEISWERSRGQLVWSWAAATI